MSEMECSLPGSQRIEADNTALNSSLSPAFNGNARVVIKNGKNFGFLILLEVVSQIDQPNSRERN
jgi:hypothetical protein